MARRNVWVRMHPDEGFGGGGYRAALRGSLSRQRNCDNTRSTRRYEFAVALVLSKYHEALKQNFGSRMQCTTRS